MIRERDAAMLLIAGVLFVGSIVWGEVLVALRIIAFAKWMVGGLF